MVVVSPYKGIEEAAKIHKALTPFQIIGSDFV
jgi:hypothetical protein